jgi:3-oxoacid CoA-transferase subunit A
MKKVYPDARSALEGLLRDGMMIWSDDRLPRTRSIVKAIRDSGVRNLTVVSNNAGIDRVGLGLLLDTKQIKNDLVYVGEARRSRSGIWRRAGDRIQPARPLAERIRAGGPGIPAFFTAPGAGP